VKKDLSIYLDLLRVLAALAVFMSHLSSMEISGGFFWQMQKFGHPAVIVFFVLSGYLIQYSVAAREHTLLDYAVARLGRLYSVVIPALILTFVFDKLGQVWFPGSYFPDNQTHPLLRLLSGLFFLSESWNWIQPMLSNLPFWSLPYEAWYYAIFGAAIFLRGGKRIGWVLLGALIAGPAILLYMPIWLCGVAAFRAGRHMRFGTGLAVLLFAATAILFAFVVGNENRWFQNYEVLYLPENVIVTDYILGPLLALNILAATRLSLPLIWLGRPVKYLAGMTFTLYLFHAPVMHLIAGLFTGLGGRGARALAVALVTFLIVWLISLVTEQKRYLWNRFFHRLLAPLAEHGKRARPLAVHAGGES
jgi:peptidoglycan/LPS O-acetylase OafA/YrhL